MNNELTYFSKSGREYTLTYNESMDITIIMDCMTQEVLNEENDERYIIFNFVSYIHGKPDDMTNEDLNAYIDRYEETLTVNGVDFQKDEEFSIYKGTVKQQIKL
jgi:hypothetical protein